MKTTQDKPDLKKCRSDALTAEELASLTVIELTPSEEAEAMKMAERAARRSRRSCR